MNTRNTWLLAAPIIAFPQLSLAQNEAEKSTADSAPPAIGTSPAQSTSPDATAQGERGSGAPQQALRHNQASDAAANNTGAPSASSTPTNDLPSQAVTFDPSLVEAVLKELENRGALGDGSDEEPLLKLYGFSDFTVRKNWHDRDGSFGPLIDRRSHFFVGNLNLYLENHIGEKFSALSEVRFLFAPLGEEINVGGILERTNTRVVDITEPGTDGVAYGGIAIERARLDYHFRQFLNLRVGYWLTPYGIWNVDHGSPTVIGTRRPFLTTQQMLPEKQSGFQLYGTFVFGNSRVGYHLTASNGRSPTFPIIDLDYNKAVGGRLFYSTDLLGDLTVGVSAYGGHSSDTSRRVAPNSRGVLTETILYNEQFKEFAFSADLRWEYKNLLIFGEYAQQDVRFREKGRPPFSTFGPPDQKTPDHQNAGAYGLIGYRFPWIGIMPYLMVEWHKDPLRPLGDALGFYSGIQARIDPRIVLKVQQTYILLENRRGQKDDLRFFETQIAWAF